MKVRTLFGGFALAAASALAATPGIDAGFYHSVALRSDGTVLTWGDDSSGQLGLGAMIESLVPIPVQNAAGITAVSAGWNYNVALKSNGTVAAWGSNTWGQLGVGSTIGRSLPTAVVNLTGIVAAAAGGDHTIALKNNGTVWVWGGNHRGQLGTGDGASTVPVQVPGLTDVVAVAAGFIHTMALKRDGTVWAWGSNTFGEIGDGTTTDRQTPVQVSGLTNVVAISAGQSHSVALRQDGTAWIWGWDGVNRTTPVQIANATGLVAVSAGGTHTLLLDHNRRAWYKYGGTANPTLIIGVENVKAVAAGYQHSVILRFDGTVWTWGENNSGQLGNGTRTATLVPAQVPGAVGITAISASPIGDHTLALASDGALWAWGDNGSGQLGQDSITFRTVPTAVSSLTGVVQVEAGHMNTYALKQDGSVWAWGAGAMNGDGTAARRSSPVQVAALSNIVAISAGSSVAVALRSDKTVWSWGSYAGDGTTNGRSIPAQVPGLPSIKAIAAGTFFSFALAEDGAVWAWGGNHNGVLGDGTTTERLSPIKIPGLTNVVAISAGGHGGALKADGTVWTWGFNGNAELGDGTFTTRLSPVQVQGLPATIVKIFMGNGQSGAIDGSGNLWMWGGNWVGQVGDGTFFPRTSAVRIAGMTNMAGGAPGGFHTLALRADGSVYGWGKNDTGPLGDGTYVSHGSPAPAIAPGAAGSLDANDWYLDLDPAAASSIPPQFVPKALAVAQLYASGALNATVRYKASEHGTTVKNYVFALVPPAFFQGVPTVAGTAKSVERRVKAGESFILAQLTAKGWTTVDGQLLAYSSGVASAAGGAANVLDSVDSGLLQGAQFCIGYGESAESMLSARAIREVLRVEGAEATTAGVPCFLQGVYLEGAPTSLFGTPVTFKASVLGLSPTGTVQFRDRGAPLQAPLALALANEAVAQAAITTASLALGTHQIDASYSGDGQNGARTSRSPMAHEVKSGASGTSSTAVSGPASSQQGAAVSFTAVVTGNNPTGTVQFFDGAAPLGESRPLVSGVAAVATTSLAVGIHSIAARYGGDPSHSVSESPALTHKVAPLGSGVFLSSSANPAAPGFPLVLTAQVQGNSPTGSVVFRDGTTDLTTVPLSGGSASTSVASLAAGNHVLVAAYSGDSSNPAAVSAGIVQQIVAPAAGQAPNPFAFAARANVAPSSTVTSNAITVSGLTGATPILVSGGTYAVNCTEPYVATSGLVTNGATVCVRHTAAATPGAVTTTTLSIGGVAATFASTTYAAGFPAAVGSAVSHYYSSILRRAADPPGKAFWEAEAMRVSALGASVSEAFFALAMTFYTSAEYAAFNRNDTGHVTDLYNSFFGRAPDAPGLAFWVSNLQQGMPREVALASFMFSTEFRNYAQGLFGNTSVRSEVDAVMDFYRGLLSRLPDDGGFDFWVRRFRAAQCQGQAAIVTEVEAISSAFALSPEYVGRGRTNAQYVGDLYNSFLRRGGDLDGVLFWIDTLTRTSPPPLTREQLRQAFRDSPEFQGRVRAIIGQGCAAGS